MTHVAPRIVNNVSFVSRINHEIHFSWQAQYLVKCKCHFSWQAQYLVKFKCHERFYRHIFSWFIYPLLFETSGTASRGSMLIL